MDFTYLEKLKEKLDSKRPLPSEVVAKLRKQIICNITYHSTTISGHTIVSLSETKAILDGITLSNRTLEEQCKIINHKEALEYIEELVKSKEILTERTIKDIHQIVLKDSNRENAGRYRNINVTISGARHVPPEHFQVPEFMEKFIQWYTDKALELHPIERAAKVHCEIVKIHPFIDGNGRTGRLLMNLELMKEGYPPTWIENEKRKEYYESLDLVCIEKKDTLFLKLLCEMIERSFNFYWKALDESSK